MPPSDSEGSRWVCAGAKRITITESDAAPTDGMISVFCRTPSNAAPGDDRSSGRHSLASRLSSGSSGDEDCVHVVITDGARTFCKRISSKDIRHMASEEGKELEKAASILLRPDDEKFKVSYKRVRGQLVGGSHDSESTASVKVSIRKTCINNIVRPVWEGQLDNICHSCYDHLPLFARNALPGQMNQTDSSSGLSFPVMLGDVIKKLHNEIHVLRTRNKQLEANTLRWKSTAEKLSNEWENEKSELTDRFLTLFNEHKAQHLETKKELDRLKGKRLYTERADNAVSDRSFRRRPNKQKHPDDEDEHDYADYDDELVARLAKGPSATQRRASNYKKPTANLKKNGQNSQSPYHDRRVGGSGFVNPHTGATEFSNPKDLFSSSEDEGTKN